MKYYDDGRVGLSFEPSGGTLRFLPEPATGDHPPFDSVGTLTHLSDTVAKLSALRGKLTIRHMALLVRVLDEMGVEVLYVERAGNHTVPFGQRMMDGDFAGYWRVEVGQARQRIGAREG